MEQITSTTNPLIKQIKSLRKKKERAAQKIFIVEGNKEIKKALDNGYKTKHCFYCENFINSNNESILNQFSQKIEISEDLFNKIALRQEGIIAVFYSKDHNIDKENFCFKGKNIIVLDQIEKPGISGE